MTPREHAQRILDAIADDDLFRRVAACNPDPEKAVDIARQTIPEFRSIYGILFAATIWPFAPATSSTK